MIVSVVDPVFFGILPLVTTHTPVKLVVHAAFPTNPPLHTPVTLAPGSGLSLGSCTVIHTCACQVFCALSVKLSRSPMWVVFPLPGVEVAVEVAVNVGDGDGPGVEVGVGVAVNVGDGEGPGVEVGLVVGVGVEVGGVPPEP